MRNGACVGGFEIATKKNVRLLNSTGENQPKDTDFEVGQIWDLDYVERTDKIAPHLEDVLIQRKKFIRFEDDINEFLKNNAPIWTGSPDKIFQSKVLFDTGHSGFITNKAGLPTQSVGFWLPDKELVLSILNGQKHYIYFNEGKGARVYMFPYVGYKSKIETIPIGSIIRVSLARWWKPGPNISETRCYCQLSGWYPKLSINKVPQNVKPVETEWDLPF